MNWISGKRDLLSNYLNSSPLIKTLISFAITAALLLYGKFFYLSILQLLQWDNVSLRGFPWRTQVGMKIYINRELEDP